MEHSSQNQPDRPDRHCIGVRFTDEQFELVERARNRYEYPPPRGVFVRDLILRLLQRETDEQSRSKPARRRLARTG